MKPLPPYGRSIVAMIQAGQRPRVPAGSIVAACDWDVARSWPRVVIADDPAAFDLSFAAGLDFLVLARQRHSYRHLNAVRQALLDAGANIAVAVTLPTLDADGYAISDERAAA